MSAGAFVGGGGAPAAEPFELEPERYELFAGPAHRFAIDRRTFLRGAGAGLIVAILPRSAGGQESGRDGRRGGRQDGGEVPAELGAWLHVGEDGLVTAYSGKAEVGQDTRTMLALAVAEELAVAPAMVTMVMADTALVPYDRGTFGSRSTPAMLPQVRRAAAVARDVLIDRAAATWKVDRRALTVKDGAILHAAGGRRLAYGELVAGGKLTGPIPAEGPLARPERWAVLGRAALKVNGRDVVTGRHRYASDVRRPGMLVGKVLRPPRFGAELEKLDDRGVRRVAGAIAVRDGGFAGVAAADEATARRALAALRPSWRAPKEAAPSARELADHFRRHAEGGGGDGDAAAVTAAIEGARHRVEATFIAPYIAHAPLEPRAAVAEWEGDRLTVWTGTQRPFGVRGELAQAFGVPEDRIRVIVPDTGAGFGGKHSGECAVEAARLARAAGRPVKLVWTREEEFTWAYFRPAALIDVRAGLASDGQLAAWEHVTYNAGGSGLRAPYAVTARREVFRQARSPLRQGSYRALAATVNHFAREVTMDELARASGEDPLAFRRRLIEEVRLRAVLEAAAERFGWQGAQASPASACGLACGVEKGGYVANCAEVRLEGGAVRVVRAVTAFECGAIVNPDSLRNQVEGSVIMGLGGALFEAIDFADGRVLNPRFSGYRVPRFGDVPRLDTVLLDRKDLPSAGGSETPIVTIAPAVANAVAAATGRPVRALPIRA